MSEPYPSQICASCMEDSINAISKALSTSPSESLEKQRKKEEVFKMLVHVLERVDDALSIHADRHNEPFVQSFCRDGKGIVRKALAEAKRTGR